MDISESREIVPVENRTSDEDKEAEIDSKRDSKCEISDGESVIDVSGKNCEISLLDRMDDSARVLYMYKNSFSLIPRSIGRCGRLKTLKFFANEIEVFPSEVGNLVELECLQVKVSSPGLSGLPLQKLRALKELELCKVPARPSAFSVLSQIASLKCLTKLSVCHFSIRYLPPEIGCLKKLEDLDLSFNKLKSLPNDIASMSALRSLRVANNKLVDLPSGLSCLQRLEDLDLSNNRLTSLNSLKLSSMHALQNLNLQHNKLLSFSQIPSWICCNMEGNGNDEVSSCLVKLDAFDATVHKIDESHSCNGYSSSSSTLLSENSSSSRCSSAQRLRRGWKRRDYLQRKARQERLNNSRRWRCDNHNDRMTLKMASICHQCKQPLLGKACELQCHLNKEQSHCPSESSSLAEIVLDTVKDLDGNGHENSGENSSQILLNPAEDSKNRLDKGYYGDNCSCIFSDPVVLNKAYDNESNRDSDEDSSLEVSKNNLKPKRHSDRDLNNPKPSKCRKPIDEGLILSCKYSRESFCSINDHLPDGFYDAGRDRPFKSLQNYEHSLCFDSREVILVDRERDEELDAIALSAQVLMSSLKQQRSSTKEKEESSVDDSQRALVLALFVSNCFGGSDRSQTVARMRKAVAGSNCQKPFVCTCPTGNNYDIRATREQSNGTVENFKFIDICERSLRFIKEQRNSNVVPIGTLRFGVCRHRAVLMKYLCDRADPPIPCELVRGYLEYMPHAWNAIIVRRDESWVRMVVDACNPTDIREETDPEYFCRYIPLTRILAPMPTENFVSSECSFPSLPLDNKAEKSASGFVIQCNFGARVAAAKVRTLEAYGSSEEEIKTFEYTCLGEVRILGVLRKHNCIVEIYGHQMSSKWVLPVDGNKEHRSLQSTIMMEYIKGGSLKSYVDKLSKGGEKHVPVKLGLFIARDVACALAEVHSKLIIHRDIKSENILIDLDTKRSDESPVVKLCDFDRAVPLQSYLHTCCIGHLGIHPPDVCVGTPRWMAPEMLQAMHRPNRYGLEVDIWSYGCLLLELLTLQVPYEGLSGSEIHQLLQMGQRPQLTDDLEALALPGEPIMAGSGSALVASEDEVESLKFLVDLFYQCTRGNPADRPTAGHIYDMLCTISPQDLTH
ncbi:leucine-rich repeat protein kinase family protein [Tasmannia lanceolata]|uniref:leucine-rich repeat protein kinase family protein n=1 Tax=Tasmannia lanceolata TaxID=3420 RepID=UPI00406436DA